VDAEAKDQQNGGDSTYIPDSKDVLLPRMQRTESMLIDHRSLHINPASALPENSCSEDTKVDTPPLLAIPPMQWLSVKVHTGPITYRKPSGKYPVQRAEGRILKITELSGLAAHSYEAWSEPAGTNQPSGAETHSQQQEARQQVARADSDMDMQVPDRPTG
jgi:hypothetical protein